MKWWRKGKQGVATAVADKEGQGAMRQGEADLASEVAATAEPGQDTSPESLNQKKTPTLKKKASLKQQPEEGSKAFVAPRPVPEGPLMEVKEVVRTFQVGGKPLHVLKEIHMQVQHQQLVMLRGRSGSGKTTLLNMLGGLDQPTKGEIWFNGMPFHKLSDNKRTVVRRQDMGFIFQAFALMPLLSAYENVELSLRMAKVPKAQWKPRVTEVMELVGLAKRMHHRPFELSGGEQQRVAIAKAIAHRPRLILADEPTAELDSNMSAQVMSVFRNIIETEGVSICMTTHDPTILEVADHVYEMVDGRFV